MNKYEKISILKTPSIIIGILIIIILIFILKNKFLSKNSLNDKNQSLDSLEKITLGGIDQWIHLKTNDTSKPILLVLHGGPGYVMMPLLDVTNPELKNEFLLVNWDQRGAGKSYSKNIPEKSMTTNQLIDDAHELTNYLKKKYGQDKIYLLAHSFGTIIGLNLIEKYPDDYLGFISCGQVVSFAENEKLSYDFALKQSYQNNNRRAIRQLERYGAPDDMGNYDDDDGYEITNEWLTHFGGSLYNENNLHEIDESIRNNPIYENDHKKIDRGEFFSQLVFDDNYTKYIDFRKQITSVNVPVYFLSGIYDYDTPSKLVEEYYNQLHAPKKELIWFENSAHFTFYEEPEKFTKTLIELVK